MKPITQLVRKTFLVSAAMSAALAAFVGPIMAAGADDATGRLAEIYNQNGLALFEKFAAGTDGNLVVSPFSIGTALSMAYAGARGTTAAEMADMLGLDWSTQTIGAVNLGLSDLVTGRASNTDAIITIANALHLIAPGDLVSDDYRNLVSRDFDAELFAGSSLAEVNSWVGNKTGGRIEQILGELDPASVAVLVNAIHFEANWQTPFDPDATRTAPFHLNAADSVDVQMMHRTVSLRTLDMGTYTALALPYDGGRLEMIIALPKAWGGAGNVPLSLSASEYASLVDMVDAVEPERVLLALPKFSFDYGTGLIPALRALGLREPFDADAADFTGIAGNESRPLYISQAEHKALIEVNEAGTEAAAATAIGMTVGAIMGESEPRRISVDRPFLFAIADRSSGALLFVGRVSDPRAGSVLSADADIVPDKEMALPEATQMMTSELMRPALAPSPGFAKMAGGGMFSPGEGDVFAGFEDGRTLSVREQPVSTFSVDVDTAAYSYVRRMLLEGALPQADAVRVEEMINYFDYAYDGPDSIDTPFALHTSVYPTPWNPGTRLLHIGIQGYRLPPEDRSPANIVLLIDTSGSMDAPDKLPLLKKSFEVLLGQLNEDDTVAIVAYAGSAGVVLEPTPASDRVKIRAALGDLTPGGSTAGAAGIELAYELATEARTESGTNRVILATDGDFNVGIDDPDALERFISRKRDSGIFLSVLGFGSGNLDDATMQALAQNGNGTAAYIDSFAEARKVLADEFGAALVTIARDVKIQVEFNPAEIAEYRLIGYETRALNSEDFNNDAVDAGDIGSGHAVTALYEITPVGSDAVLNDALRYGDDTVEPQSGDKGEIAFVKLRYKPGTAGQSRLITQPVLSGAALTRIDDAPESARFATAVAGFGQKLRDNPALADWDWMSLAALARSARGTDENGYKAEMARLVEMAASIDTE